MSPNRPGLDAGQIPQLMVFYVGGQQLCRDEARLVTGRNSVKERSHHQFSHPGAGGLSMHGGDPRPGVRVPVFQSELALGVDTTSRPRADTE